MLRITGAPRRSLYQIAAFCLLGLCFWLSGCSREVLKTEDGEPGPDNWELGESSTYNIPADEDVRIIDDVTGHIIRIPDTGGGSLTVTAIVSGPQAAPDDSAFALSYTGAGPVQIMIPHGPEDFDFVFGYSSFQGVILEGDEGSDYGWLPFPVTETIGDTLVFGLLNSEESKNVQAALWQGITNFKRLKIKPGTEHGDLMRVFEQNVRDALNNLILVVPAARRDQTMQDIDGPFKRTVFVDINTGSWWPTKPKYVAFWTFVPAIARCALMMKDDYAGSVAHEVGHYLHHVLVKNNLYLNFAMNARPYGHKIGSAGARNNVIEEPAYFAEYVLNRTINNGNPEQGTFLSSLDHVSDPMQHDYLDLEGMGVMILASLTRQGDTIFSFYGPRVPVPVVQGDLNERYQACYEGIAQGANTIPSFRYKMHVYLSESGQQDKIPAMLQPLGWSHFAGCRFVDEQSNPLENHTARSVSIAGGATYRLPLGRAVAATPGGYLLERVYPGDSILRIYRPNGDSIDVARNIEWGTSTNQKQEWGDIVVPQQNLLALLQQRGNIHTFVFAYIDDPLSEDPRYQGFSVSNTVSCLPGAPALTWEGTGFSFTMQTTEETIYHTAVYTDSLQGEVSPDGRSIEWIRLYSDRTTTYPQGGRYQWQTDITIRDIPVTAYPGDEWQNTEFQYYLLPEEAPDRVVSCRWYHYYNNQEMVSTTFISPGSEWSFAISTRE
ncbi:MAG: hypothetical protein KJ970_20695 [Candidatus Eisenbacteria bacterium]|uniref:Uncharacterized protein n=1 Tax=Eiseniibacteriota bacterium TaxID=2212470 RepID=A0A948RYU3_UNCEI|nr:hypothetical protein [Candidatus Eisenbacteria bacterium]MBU1947206.1 hypothetical protein [Candidatus Eisenbacteria bacterium]MBU2693345.1 hypothetical protein [Candidatus Eisenbacteria bacterium]